MSSTQTKPLTEALTEALTARATAYSEAVDKLRDLDSKNEFAVEASLLREAVELVRCLRRLVGNATTNEIHRAFGAPGDFGYDTPIGDALAKVYRGG